MKLINSDNPLIKIWKEKRNAKPNNRVSKAFKNQASKKLVSLSENSHKSVFSKLDCLECANCCSTIPPIVNRPDRKRIAKYLGLNLREFENNYIKQDSDGDYVFLNVPCSFLNLDNTCEIYEVRPEACRQYPHTDGYEFIRKISIHDKNINHCPAAFHIIEKMLKSLKN